MVVIIMGVSGSGKTTIGSLLANELNGLFFDADNFHPKNNIIKMSKGFPLTDNDRLPWLKNLSKKIKIWGKGEKNVFVACSALKESYRKILMKEKMNWIFLKGSFSLISKRLKNRNNHFMKKNLLKSQFEILEPPSYGIHLNINQTPSSIVKKILLELSYE